MLLLLSSKVPLDELENNGLYICHFEEEGETCHQRVKILPQGESRALFSCDSGITSGLEGNTFFRLPPELSAARLPLQAIRCGLHNLKPPGDKDGNVWSTKAGDLLFDLCSGGKEFQAIVTSKEEDGNG